MSPFIVNELPGPSPVAPNVTLLATKFVANILFHLLAVEPMLCVFVVSGIKFESTSA